MVISTTSRRLTNPMGTRYFHSRLNNWSIRRRGNVHLNHMMINITTAVLPKNQIIEGISVIGINDSIALKYAIADLGNKSPDPRYNTNGIFMEGRRCPSDSKPHHVIIRNCTVAKCPGGGITMIEGDYFTVEDCIVYNNCWFMRYGGSGITTLNNWAYDNEPGYHIIIQRNLVWNNKCFN